MTFDKQSNARRTEVESYCNHGVKATASKHWIDRVFLFCSCYSSCLFVCLSVCLSVSIPVYWYAIDVMSEIKTSCRWAAATICLRPCKLTISSYLFARWHQFRRVGYLRHQQQVDLWPFDLESAVRVKCDVGYLCANFSLPRPLCSRVRPDVRDRQTSDKSIA